MSRIIQSLESSTSATTQKNSNVEEIIVGVEEDIVLGRLHPRERLVEEDMMERFACKRHVARQALFQLEQIGLIERIKNRGAFVKSYPPEEVENLYDMREILELAAVNLIQLPGSPAWLAELENLHIQHSKAVDDYDLRKVFRLNIAFHRAFFSACGNPFLFETINEFAQKAHGIRFVALSDHVSLNQARQEHQAMIDAIRDGDKPRLALLCKEHLQPSKSHYLKLYQHTL